MRRGEIRLVDLDPARGNEADKRRPAILVSNDVVTVVPVTSNTDRILAFQALLPASDTGLRLDSKAQAEQVRSVSVERIGPLLGRASAEVLSAVDDALRLHLDL